MARSIHPTLSSVANGLQETLRPLLEKSRQEVTSREARYREQHHLQQHAVTQWEREFYLGEENGEPVIEEGAPEKPEATLEALENSRHMGRIADEIGECQALLEVLPDKLVDPILFSAIIEEIRDYEKALEEALGQPDDALKGAHPEYLLTLLLQLQAMLEAQPG